MSIEGLFSVEGLGLKVEVLGLTVDSFVGELGVEGLGLNEQLPKYI